MLHRTQGVVIGFIKYRESSIITKIYTEKFGIQSYIVNNIRSKRAKNKIALFQTLSILDLVVYKKNNANLNRISEYKTIHPFQSIPFNVHKSTIALFISDFCNKAIREEDENPNLFNFLKSSFIQLDLINQNIFNFHLQFMLKLSKFIGLELESASMLVNESGDYSSVPKYRLKEEITLNLVRLNYGEHCQLKNSQREEILNDLMKFYSFHIPEFGVLKSLNVLKELYRD